MADETNPNPPAPETQPSRAQERITELSDKVKQEAEGRKVAEDKAAALEKKAAFAEGYADMLTTHPAAKEFKADIETKVNAGYTVEDATLAVLGKAGKLGFVGKQPESPAGGSATTTLNQSGEKSVAEMTQEERRKKLSEELVWQ